MTIFKENQISKFIKIAILSLLFLSACAVNGSIADEEIPLNQHENNSSIVIDYNQDNNEGDTSNYVYEQDTYEEKSDYTFFELSMQNIVFESRILWGDSWGDLDEYFSEMEISEYFDPELARANYVDSRFLYNFENVYEFTYTDWETDFYTSIVIWPDSYVYNFSFVALDYNGEFYNDEYTGVLSTATVVGTIDAISPNDVVILNVAFSHYLRPHGGIIFSDENGVETRLFILENMIGGHYSPFSLSRYIPNNSWVRWD